MSNPVQPRVVFVDGPTGAGKDFFIDRFCFTYNQRYPERNITNVRAVDFVLGDFARSEDRKYTQYDTPLEKTEKIYQGHLHLLTHVANIAKLDPHCLVVVNRSFLSYLVYNWYNLFRSTTTTAQRTTLGAIGPVSYADAFHFTLAEIPTMFVNLRACLGLSEQGQVNLLLERARKRKDNKDIDPAWFAHLVQNYHQPCKKLTGLFGVYEVSEASQYHRLFFKHFHRPPV